MTETIIATRLVTPVFNPIDVNETPLVTDQNHQKGLTTSALVTLLKAKGIAENKPGFIISKNTLSTRILWINKAVPQFQRRSYKPLTPYQVWVILKVHEMFYQVQPASHRQIALAVRANSSQFTYEAYINEARNTTRQSKSHRDSAGQLVEPVEV